MSEVKKVSFKKRADRVFGGIYPEQRTSVVLNKEGMPEGDLNRLYPVYSTDTITQVLKVRSKALIAEELGKLNEVLFTQENHNFICWYSAPTTPLCVPSEMIDFVKNMTEGDYGFPVMFDSIASGVAQQPISIWIMVPNAADEFVPHALKELKRWIETSRRWWDSHGSGMIRQKTIEVIMRNS